MKLSLFIPSSSARSTIPSNLNSTKKTHFTVKSGDVNKGDKILPPVPVVHAAPKIPLASVSERIEDPLLRMFFNQSVKNGTKIDETALLPIEPWHEKALHLVNFLFRYVGDRPEDVRAFAVDLLGSLLSKARNRGAIKQGHYSSISFQAQELKKATNNAKSGEEIENRVYELFNFISDLEGENLASQQTRHIVGKLVKNVYNGGINLQLFSDKSTEAAANKAAQDMKLDLVNTMKEGIDALREARKKFPDLFSKDEARANQFIQLEERFESGQTRSQNIQNATLAEIAGLLPDEVDNLYRESGSMINVLLGYQQTIGVEQYLKLARKRTDQTKDYVKERIESIENLLEENPTPDYYVKQEIAKRENAISYIDFYGGKLTGMPPLSAIKMVVSKILEKVSENNPRKITDSEGSSAINSERTLYEIKKELQSQLEILKQLQEFPEQANTLFVDLKARHDVLDSARPNRQAQVSLGEQEKLNKLLAEASQDPLFEKPIQQLLAGKKVSFNIKSDLPDQNIVEKLGWFDGIIDENPESKEIKKLHEAFVANLLLMYSGKLSAPVNDFTTLKNDLENFDLENFDPDNIKYMAEDMIAWLTNERSSWNSIQKALEDINSTFSRGLDHQIFIPGGPEEQRTKTANQLLINNNITEESLLNLRQETISALAEFHQNPEIKELLTTEFQDLEDDAPELHSEILKTMENLGNATDIAEAKPTLNPDISTEQNPDTSPEQEQIDKQDENDINPQGGQGGSPKPQPTNPNSGGDTGGEAIKEKPTGRAGDKAKENTADSGHSVIDSNPKVNNSTTNSNKPGEVNWANLAKRTQRMLKANANGISNAEPETPLDSSEISTADTPTTPQVSNSPTNIDTPTEVDWKSFKKRTLTRADGIAGVVSETEEPPIPFTDARVLTGKEVVTDTPVLTGEEVGDTNGSSAGVNRPIVQIPLKDLQSEKQQVEVLA